MDSIINCYLLVKSLKKKDIRAVYNNFTRMNFLLRNVLILISFISLINVSCHKEKSDPPVIIINEPAFEFSYQIYDTIHVTARVDDDIEITKLTCSIINYLYTPVLSVQNFKVNKASYTMDCYFVIDNTEIQTGNYKVMIFASDGENDVRAYQSVIMNELPRHLESVYISAADNNSAVKVFKLDSTTTPLLVSTIPGDFSGASMSTKYRQYYTLGNYTGNLSAFNIQNQTVDWSISNNATGGAPYFTGISRDKEVTYVGRYDGKIIGYNNFGMQQFLAETDLNNFPGLTLPIGERLLAIETSIFNGNKNLLIYNKPAGIVLFKIPLNFEVKGMVEKNNNEVYLIATDNGISKIFLLDLNTAMVNLRLTLTTIQLNGATAISEYVLILSTHDGLYEFNNNSSSLIPLITGYATTLVKYDDAENEVYAVHGKTIDVYGYQLHTLVHLSSFNVSDTIRSLDFLYNREKFK